MSSYDLGFVLGDIGVQGYAGGGAVALYTPITSTVALRVGQSYVNLSGSPMDFAGVEVQHGELVRIATVDYVEDVYTVTAPEQFTGKAAIAASVTFVLYDDTTNIPEARHGDVVLCASDDPIIVYGRRMIRGDILTFEGIHTRIQHARAQSILGRASSDGGAHILEAVINA